MTRRTLPLRDGMFDVEVGELGDGPPLVYLHGIWDAGDDSFVAELAATFTVIRPYLPGFGASTVDERLHDVHDAIYYLLDVLDAIGVADAPLVGHCLGGMFAAELAAVQPRRFAKLVLIAPFGLWNAACPTLDFFAAAPDQLAAALYGEHGEPTAESVPASPEDRVQQAVAKAKAREVAARFLWPLPNHGLAKRAHRISMPTLIVWGSEDGICPPEYGADFQRLIAGAQLEMVTGAGHLPHCQQREQVATRILGFLNATLPSP